MSLSLVLSPPVTSTIQFSIMPSSTSFFFAEAILSVIAAAVLFDVVDRGLGKKFNVIGHMNDRLARGDQVGIGLGCLERAEREGCLPRAIERGRAVDARPHGSDVDVSLCVDRSDDRFKNHPTAAPRNEETIDTKFDKVTKPSSVKTDSG